MLLPIASVDTAVGKGTFSNADFSMDDKTICEDADVVERFSTILVIPRNYAAAFKESAVLVSKARGLRVPTPTLLPNLAIEKHPPPQILHRKRTPETCCNDKGPSTCLESCDNGTVFTSSFWVESAAPGADSIATPQGTSNQRCQP